MWLQAILGILAAAPKLLDMIKSIAQAILAEIGNIEEARAKKEMAAALAKAQATKNTCDIEKQFNPDVKCDAPPSNPKP